ncbi:MAG: TolB family protein, partial [Planctomycetota bacterium]
MKHLKSIRIFIVLLSCGIILLFICPRRGPEPKLIPREVLFGNPVKMRPRISPDGTMMAYIAPVENVLNVWVKTIGKENDRAVTKDDNRGIRRYFWAEDSKHIMYLQDVGGNENWRLYGVNPETDEIKDLTPYEDVQVRIVATDKHFPNELLIGMNKEDPKVHDVYHLDLTSGELELVAKNPGNVMSWDAD